MGRAVCGRGARRFRSGCGGVWRSVRWMAGWVSRESFVRRRSRPTGPRASRFLHCRGSFRSGVSFRRFRGPLRPMPPLRLLPLRLRQWPDDHLCLNNQLNTTRSTGLDALYARPRRSPFAACRRAFGRPSVRSLGDARLMRLHCASRADPRSTNYGTGRAGSVQRGRPLCSGTPQRGSSDWAWVHWQFTGKRGWRSGRVLIVL